MFRACLEKSFMRPFGLPRLDCLQRIHPEVLKRKVADGTPLKSCSPERFPTRQEGLVCRRRRVFWLLLKQVGNWFCTCGFVCSA